MIKRIHIEDSLDTAERRAIEVVLEMSDGTRRWCFFFTPQGIVSCGDYVGDTRVRIHYGASHMFIVSEISKEIIEAALFQVEARGELENCTLPVADED